MYFFALTVSTGGYKQLGIFFHQKTAYGVRHLFLSFLRVSSNLNNFTYSHTWFVFQRYPYTVDITTARGTLLVQHFLNNVIKFSVHYRPISEEQGSKSRASSTRLQAQGSKNGAPRAPVINCKSIKSSQLDQS